MRILIVADPIESFKTYKDSTYAIMAAAAARGHTLAFCEQGQLWLEGGHAWADASALELSGPQLGEAGHDAHGWWRCGAHLPFQGNPIERPARLSGARPLLHHQTSAARIVRTTGPAPSAFASTTDP